MLFIIEKQAGSLFISILNNNNIFCDIFKMLTDENASFIMQAKNAVWYYASLTNYTPLET